VLRSGTFRSDNVAMDMKFLPNYSRFTEVLLTWQKLHRASVRNGRFTSWDSASRLVQSAKELEGYARQHLEEALADSDAELSPLSDPLGLSLGEHRWLSADREESYSDWLAWILQEIGDAEDILPLFSLSHGSAGSLGLAERVSREVPGDHGRTDVEVWFGERGLLLIEVKVQPPGDNLRSQLDGYAKWAETRRGVQPPLLVLLGTEEPKRDIGKFVFTDWRDVCIRLRRYAKRMKDSHGLRAAAILIFCGAVEQNLLRLSGRPAPFRAMATTDYLREWRGKRMSGTIPDEVRQFLITGAKTYLDAHDAMAEFRRKIQDQIVTLARRCLHEINRACDMDWTQNDLTDYTEHESDRFYAGKQLAVKDPGGSLRLYFYFRIVRENDSLVYTTLVDLYRINRGLAKGLWESAAAKLAAAPDTASWSGNDIWFHQRIPSENETPNFLEYLDRALQEFIGFIGECGGLRKHLPQEPGTAERVAQTL